MEHRGSEESDRRCEQMGFIGHSDDLGFYSICDRELLEVLIINGMIQFSSFKR